VGDVQSLYGAFHGFEPRHPSLTMATFERSTWIDAPLAEVWAFHATTDGLVHVTPDWLGLRVEGVDSPGEAYDAPELTAGAEVTLVVRPVGGGPRVRWTSRIVARERDDGRALFRDRMISGPFQTWIHTHRFAAEDGGTRMVDHVQFELPLGPLSGASAVALPGFELVFADRHRRTRTILER